MFPGFIPLMLAAVISLVAGPKVDIDCDGKNEQIFFRATPTPVIDLARVNEAPPQNIEFLVKKDGKFIKVGQLNAVTGLWAERIYTIMSDGKPEKAFAIFRIEINRGTPVYWAIGWPDRFFMVPEEFVR